MSAQTKKVWKLIVCPSYMYIYIRVCVCVYKDIKNSEVVIVEFYTTDVFLEMLEV